MQVEDLQKFCSVNAGRPQLLEPFSIGDFTYATDGRILIRVPVIAGVRTDNVPAGAAELVPDFVPDEVWSEVVCPPGWESFSESQSPCKECNGVGRRQPCSTCDGEGECSQCGHECKDCGGSGFSRMGVAGLCDPVCEECDGEGVILKPFWVALSHGAVVVSLHYLRLVKGLEGAVLRWNGNPNAMMCFDFNGGRGVLMPARGTHNDGIPVGEQWKGSGEETAVSCE